MRKIISTLILFTLLFYKIDAQTGISVPEMSACEGLIMDFLDDFDIPGASFAIAKDGKLIYNRAFGNANLEGTEAVQPYHLFRIASVSKPITAIAIMKMVEEGQVSLSDKVFGEGGLLEEHPVISNASISDSRIHDITVQNLLEHSAGWNRDLDCFPNPTNPYPYYFSGCDPIVAPLHVTETNGTVNPATEKDMIVFLMGKGLDFDPNTAYSYSNVGYLVLGEIIEEISGETYENYVQNLFAQIGVCDMHLGFNLLSNKQEREVEYTGNGYTTLSCYNTGENVPWEYGGFNLEAMDAHGGWIATSRDLVKLLVSVDGFSTKPDILSESTISIMIEPSGNNANYAKGWSVNVYDNWWHSGSLDGTASIIARTSGGYTWAILLNKRVSGVQANQFWIELDALPWNCISNTSEYPIFDLLDFPLTNSDSISFTSVSSTEVTLSWESGTGDKRIVVAKENGTITDFPMDGSSYNANSEFGMGDDLGNNSYVVYDGKESNVTVTNLEPNTSYSFRVFDYNESANTGNNKLYKLCGNSEYQALTTEATNRVWLINSERVKVYPTLANNQITIELSAPTLETYYEIYTPAGKKVDSGVLTGTSNIITISDRNAGIYLLKIKIEGEMIWGKFIKN